MTDLWPHPQVSVIVPAFNAEAYLADAVRSALDQTWPELQVIVVDDGSSDGTLAIARWFAERDSRVVPVSQGNAGPSAARNAGLSMATGEAISFLDADDAYLPEKIERQIDVLRRRPECDLVYSDFYVGDGRLQPIALRSVSPIDAPMREALAYRTPFAPISVLMRRSLAEATGGFDPDIRACEDRDYWIRAERHGRFCYLAGPVGIYRTHPGQRHHTLTREREGQRAVVAKNFRRGSVEWRIAQSCLAYSDARVAWGHRRLGSVVAGLIRSAWHARSWSRFGSVRRWGGYG